MNRRQACQVAALVGAGAAMRAFSQEAQDGTPTDRKGPPERSPTNDASADQHTAKPAKSTEPDHFRGQIVSVQGQTLVMKTRAGKTVEIAVPDGVPILALGKGSFTAVDFGTYVGAVGVKLDEYSPIVRDSAVWLHRGFELRILDEELRGLSLGHKDWDLVPGAIISHGWVDDIEVRVLSIKWGPTDYDETDMEVPRDVPVQRMSVSNRTALQPGVHVLVGANRVQGRHVAAFVIAGKDGIVPAL